MNVQRPSPSGDDTDSLQRAIDAATKPSSGYAQGHLCLDGEYRISRTLRIGCGEGKRPVALLASQAALTWIGDKTDAPMIEYRGEGMTAAIRMSGLLLDCNHKARGIAVYRQCYGAEFSHLLIRGARQVALDMIGCWGSHVEDVTFQACRGINLRLHGSNTARINGVRFGGLGEDWPPEDDSTAIDWDGKPLRTPASERACIVSTNRTGNLNGSAWIIEAAKYAGYPLINYQAKRLRLTSLHVESCQGSQILRERVGGDNVVDGLWVVNTSEGQIAPPIPLAE